MARCSEHHMEVGTTGVGKCSVPMWMDGIPGGFCDRPAYGKVPPGKQYRNGNEETVRMDGRYNGHVPGLACAAHGGPKVVYEMDGNLWCATLDSHINLQESPAGFGETQEDALEELEREIGKVEKGGE